MSTPYITQYEAAELLKVTDRTIRNWIASGQLKGYRIGRTIRLKRSEVEAALQPVGGTA